MFRTLLVMVLLVASSLNASAQRTCDTPAGGETTCTYNGITFTMADLRKFAPEVQFHFAERFYPASIDWILERSKLVDADGHPRIISGLRQQGLADFPDDRVIIDSIAFRGMPPVNDWSPAPMYVAVQVPASRDWIDLHYIMLYPYNGPQTYRALRCGTEFNFFGETMAEHQGDIEMISVRVTPDFSQMLAVRYESHGDSRYFNPEQVTFQVDAAGNRTHPIASSALHSHSTWNPSAYNPQDWEYSYELDCSGGTIDLIGSALPGRGSASRVKWRPWDPSTGASLTLIGLDAAGLAVNDQVWAAFQGRLGAEQENAITDNVYGIGLNPDGTPESLPGLDKTYAVLMLEAGGFILNLKDLLGLEDKDGKFHANGPGGPGGRDWIGPPSPSTVYLRSRVENPSANGQFNLYLTAGLPAGLPARATVETLQVCSAAQVWETSLWPVGSDGKAGTSGAALLNRLTGSLLEHTGYRSPVTMTVPLQLANITPNRVWSIGGREFFADVSEPARLAPGYGFAAFRPVADIDSNLNVWSDDEWANPGTTVGVWDWAICWYSTPLFPLPLFAGCPNIIWRFESAACPAPATSAGAIVGTLGDDGWYVSDPTTVSVTGSATATAIRYGYDNGALVNSPGPAVNVPVSGDGQHSFTFGALDGAGNLENPMHQLAFKIDSTAPSIVGSRSPLANAFGWNNTAVSVSFACGDATSGVESCTPTQTVSSEGAAQAVVGSARDSAGNTASAAVTGISIDRTPPIVTTVVLPPPNAQGWHNTPATVSVIATDALSGIASTSDPVTIGGDGASYTVVGTATDKADNTTSITTVMNVDQTPPELYLQFDSVNRDVTLFARDALSGVASGALTPTSAVQRCNESDWATGEGGSSPDDADDREWVHPCRSDVHGERRIYSVPDRAGNAVEVVLDVLVHREKVRARFVSIGYNNRPAVTVSRNVASFRAYRAPAKPLDVEQQLRFDIGESTEHVNASFDARKGTTTILAVRAGQSTRSVRSGLVLLKLATAAGMLKVEY